MPDSHADLRSELVRKLTCHDPRVTEAMLSVPRHVFLPDVTAAEAYADTPVVIKKDQDGHALSSASQPALVAIMLDLLDLSPGQRVLEIGAGTGYNAALIRNLTGPDGTVVSVDIDQDIVDAARSALDKAGYRDVVAVCADGALGYPALAPYDRLVATVGVSDLAPAWLDQVTHDALLLVPLDVRGVDLLVAFTRVAGHWESRAVEPCGFIRMRGALADSTRTVSLGGPVKLQAGEATGPGGHPLDSAGLAAAFTGPAVSVDIGSAPVTDQPSADRARLNAGKLRIWLATTEPRYCAVTEVLSPDRTPRLSFVPAGGATWATSIGLVADASLAILARPETSLAAADPDGPLAATGYGPDGASLAADLAGLIQAWRDAGRPGWTGLHVDAYPRTGTDQPPDASLIIDRPHTRFAVYRT